MISNSLGRVGAPMVLAGALALAAGHASADEAPYAGQQNRPIKSLSEQEVAALLAGQGAGYAKAAELNGYPGPAHVLELAAALRLSRSQLRATEALMKEHRARARRLGSELVASEAGLDRLFQQKQAVPEDVDRATQMIAELQARLRAEHLKTHLAQTALLDAEQIARYAALRGYREGATPASASSAPAHEHHGGTGGRP
jgi:hypothetical protein